VVTNWRGQIHERLEYTPYGELWIDWKGGTALEDTTPFRFTGKEMDAETGFYYYGARYLDPKTSRWISADPALGDYVPSAPINDEAKKRNGNLPGMGGVFNYVNLHVYHYAGNNPVKYIDPDGMTINWEQGSGVSDEQMAAIRAEEDRLMNSGTEAGNRYKELYDSQDVTVTIRVNAYGDTRGIPENSRRASNGKGSNSSVFINANDTGNYTDSSVKKDIGATLAHEVSGHAYDIYKGNVPSNARKEGLNSQTGLITERRAVAMENEYRSFKGLQQRATYSIYGSGKWDMPIYAGKYGWFVVPGEVVNGKYQQLGNRRVSWIN
jgi:RHS repeat-associated protein